MLVTRCCVGLSLLGLTAGACSDSFTGASGGNGPELAEVPSLYAEYLCKALKGCTPQFAEIFLGPNDCVTLWTNRIEQATLPLLEAAVAKGSMNYRPEKLFACLERIKALGCKALDNTYIEECEAALGGTVEEEGDCRFDGECTADNYCYFGGTCPGTCKERELAGSACRDDTWCQPGDKCFAGRCASPGAVGELCVPGGVGCKSGLFCGPGDGAGRTCVSVDSVFTAELGELCSMAEGKLCQMGSYCAAAPAGLAAPTQTCVAQAESGGSCNFSVADMCPKDEYCGDTFIAVAGSQLEGECKKLPLDGEACTSKGDFGKACAAGHVCVTSGQSAVCRKLKKNGSACEVNEECYSGKCDELTCAPKADCGFDEAE